MKRTIIFAFIFLNTLINYGQKQHLEPATFFVGGGLENYYRNLNSFFYDEMSEIPYARFMVIPSFTKEYGFSVEKQNKGYFIISISPSESYWRAKNKENVEFETKKYKIDKKTYNKIGYLFHLLAEQTKSCNLINHTLDGENFYFITTDNKGKIKIGKTRQPGDDCLLGRLVKLSESLYSIGNGNNVSISEINSEIDKLIIELEE